MGSKFSMLQMVMQVSAPSRITSYSISFQPSGERDRQRLDVDAVRHLRVSHDRRGVRVDQHYLAPFFSEGTAGLCAGIVELRRLTNHNWPAADHHDFLDAGIPWHARFARGVGC